jgi:hypothetical protein
MARAKKFVVGLLLILAMIAFVLTGWYLEFVAIGYVVTPIFDAVYKYSPELMYLVLIALAISVGVMIGRATSPRGRY